MDKAISPFIAAVAALALSGGAYAQSNNTLATPTTQSPAAMSPAPVSPANATSGYGTPAAAGSDSGMGAGTPNMGLQNGTTNSLAPGTPAFGINNTLATPSTASPANGN